jgi:predicted GNAT family acetyltransferase
MELSIEHEPERLRFVCRFEQDEAEICYRLVTADEVDFHHTFVPPALRKHGVAVKLVEAAHQWALSEHFKVRASCWFAAKCLGLETSH